MAPDADSRITCPVCSEAFPNDRFAKDTLKRHYWQKHTGFPKFSKRESQRLLFIMSPAVVVLVILLLLVNPSSPEFYYPSSDTWLSQASSSVEAGSISEPTNGGGWKSTLHLSTSDIRTS